MMVTAEKDIGGFQLDQKYFELPSVVRRDVGKSGNWPAHPNTMFVMDGIKPRITLPGSNQGGGKPAISNKRRGFSCHYTLPPFRFSTSHHGRRAAMLKAPSPPPPPKNFRHSASSRLSIASTMIVSRPSSSAFPRLHAATAH